MQKLPPLFLSTALTLGSLATLGSASAFAADKTMGDAAQPAMGAIPMEKKSMDKPMHKKEKMHKKSMDHDSMKKDDMAQPMKKNTMESGAMGQDTMPNSMGK